MKLAEQRIDDIAALLLYKLHTVEVAPLFLNPATPGRGNRCCIVAPIG